jgi:lysyl-tRNA synthetase class I
MTTKSRNFHRRYAIKHANTKIVEVAKWVPNYEVKCENCGQVPTVTGVDKNGNVVKFADLCGPCTWGEAATLDPKNW